MKLVQLGNREAIEGDSSCDNPSFAEELIASFHRLERISKGALATSLPPSLALIQ
jgi:hypothetical protein